VCALSGPIFVVCLPARLHTNTICFDINCVDAEFAIDFSSFVLSDYPMSVVDVPHSESIDLTTIGGGIFV
jgi:hypothetical protein